MLSILVFNEQLGSMLFEAQKRSVKLEWSQLGHFANEAKLNAAIIRGPK